MKTIVLLGAGSASFALAWVKDILLSKGLEGAALRLVDINSRRLEEARAMVEAYKREVEADHLGVEAYTDRRPALEGADYVICAVKIGGYIPLENERKIAEAHGYYRGIGDRVSCYYGGVGAFWQLRFLEELARDMEELCPDALLIQTANPVFEGNYYLTKYTKVKAVGVCHGHFGYRGVAEILGLDPAKATAEVIGFNHCTYLTDFRYEGKDAYPLLDRWIEEKAEAYWKSDAYLKPNSLGFSPDALSPGAVDAYRHYGLLPIGDAIRSVSPWWHHTDLETKKKWYGTGGGFDSAECWAIYLADKDVEHENLRRSMETGEPISKIYPLTRSGEQHIQIIEAMETDTYTRLTLNIPNNGCIDGLPDDALVEIPAMVSARGIQGIRMPPLPSRLMNNVMLPRLCRANNILDAYRTGSRDLLVVELMNDHRTRSYEQAKELIDDLLRQDWNKEADAHYR